jgi:hypothetical protein
MKTFKIFILLAILLVALFVSGAPASARSLAASGVTFINGVFASGSGSAPLASTHYQMQAVVGEAGLPDSVTYPASAHYQHQPGFLAAAASPTRTPTSIPVFTPSRTPTMPPTRTPTLAFTPSRTPTMPPTPTRAPAITTFQSAGVYDGWVLESSETSNAGGTINSAAATFNLGDNAAKKQYRGILSFNTGAALPDTAQITAVTLRVKQQTILGGGSPVTIFQGFMADVKNGFFGTTPALQTGDFQAAASKSYGPFNTALVGGWYNINLTGAKAYVNKLTANFGLTQIRLRFNLDDNNNAIANVLSLYSGNAGTAAYRPQLVITYYTAP